jgi:hypothetical protein
MCGRKPGIELFSRHQSRRIRGQRGERGEEAAGERAAVACPHMAGVTRQTSLTGVGSPKTEILPEQELVVNMSRL